MQYYQTNQAAIQQEAQQLDKQANEWGVNAPMLYLLNGTTLARILPAYSEAGVWFTTIAKHRVRVGTRIETVACPAHNGLSCLICQKGEELTQSKDETKMAFARENLRPRTQYLYNVLAYAGPANKKGEAPQFGKVYVLEAGVMVHRQIISLDQDPQAGWNNLADPNNGVTLIFKRVGQGLDTKYEVHPHGQGRTSVFSDLQARGVDPGSLKLHQLDSVYTLPSAEKQQEIVSQLGAFGATARAAVSPATFQPVQPQAAPTFAPVQPTPANGGFVPVSQPVQPQAPAFTPVQPVAPTQTAPVIPPPPGQ